MQVKKQLVWGLLRLREDCLSWPSIDWLATPLRSSKGSGDTAIPNQFFWNAISLFGPGSYIFLALRAGSTAASLVHGWPMVAPAGSSLELDALLNIHDL